MSLPNVAKTVPCSLRTIYRYRDKALLPVICVGKREYVESAVLVRWLPLMRVYLRLMHCLLGHNTRGMPSVKFGERRIA